MTDYFRLYLALDYTRLIFYYSYKTCLWLNTDGTEHVLYERCTFFLTSCVIKKNLKKKKNVFFIMCI